MYPTARPDGRAVSDAGTGSGRNW